MDFDAAARLVGGIGLFLLGMRLMTEGLKVAAGQALRQILARSTATRVRGVASGFLVTSLVQSSSAVTVATIGFVNAGLLSLGQALAVTYGSNIGTTMTGWLVALVGFHVNIRAFALPLIGVGMALRLVSTHGRLGPLGEALTGFGVFFLGIELLRSAFDGLSGHIELAALAGAGAPWALLLVAIGFALTVLMQSSSAAIAIILTAAGGGVLPLGSGAALVVGANLGTTSTAAVAVLGATPNAKRVAAGHIAFNVITGAVALALLPLLLAGIVWGRESLRLDAEPASVLAAFHTTFNLLGVALLWPLTTRLIHFLERRFRTAEEDEAAPRFLDRNVLATPRLALDAMVLELTRVGQITRRLVRSALGADARAPEIVATGRRSVTALIDAIGEYTQLLQRARIPAEMDSLLPAALQASRYYAEAAELAEMIAAERGTVAEVAQSTAQDAIRDFVARVDALVAHAGIEEAGYRSESIAEEVAVLEKQYQQLKATLLGAGAQGMLGVHEVVALLDWLSNVRRGAHQLERGTRTLASLAEPAERSFPAAPEGAIRAGLPGRGEVSE